MVVNTDQVTTTVSHTDYLLFVAQHTESDPDSLAIVFLSLLFLTLYCIVLLCFFRNMAANIHEERCEKCARICECITECLLISGLVVGFTVCLVCSHPTLTIPLSKILITGSLAGGIVYSCSKQKFQDPDTIVTRVVESVTHLAKLACTSFSI